MKGEIVSQIEDAFLTLRNIGEGNYFSSDLDTFIEITVYSTPPGDEVTQIDLRVTRFRRPGSEATRFDRLGIDSDDKIVYAGALEFAEGKSQSIPPAGPIEMLAIVDQVMREKGK